MGAKKGLGTIIGGAIVAFVVLNAQFGLVAPMFIEDSEGYKLDVVLLADPNCAFQTIENELQTSGASYCLQEKGQWDGADFMMLAEGLVILLAGRWELPQHKRWAQRVRKVGFVAGIGLFSIAILDRLGWLPHAASSEGLATLMPFNIQPWLLQIAIAGLGYMLIRGPKYWDPIALEQSREKTLVKRERKAAFANAFYAKDDTTHDKTKNRIQRSRLLQQDTNLKMKKRRKGLLVMATCPYCKGKGCKKCNQLGVF
jgi:hypothetical protein